MLWGELEVGEKATETLFAAPPATATAVFGGGPSLGSG